MKKHAVALAAATLLLASSAQGAMIAGWDFSQYVPGLLSTDGGSSPAQFLSANYSDLDNQGIPVIGEFGSSQFGTMDLGFVPVGPPTDPFEPATPILTGASLISNNEAPSDPVVMDFTAQASLLTDGQLTWNDLSLLAGDQAGGLGLVFEATLAPLGGATGTDWRVDFGALAASTGTSSNIDIEVSTDGGLTFDFVSTVTAVAADLAYGADLPDTDGLQSVLVRLLFDGSPVFIDNVSIGATLATPEPATALLGLAGMLGLALAGRRRRA